ncbi:MAG: hypothetical protein U5K53_06130 [Halanaerobiales bacterium]|nr:hypothetical protein [Halanaerobiales bacterium]
MNEKRIMARPFFKPIHTMLMYNSFEKTNMDVTINYGGKELIYEVVLI